MKEKLFNLSNHWMKPLYTCIYFRINERRISVHNKNTAILVHTKNEVERSFIFPPRYFICLQDL